MSGASETSKRVCDHEGCQEPAPFRAPKAPDVLDDYFWFCQEHVREYNLKWNFFDTASEAELAAQMNHTSLDYVADVDELTRAGLATAPSRVVAPPRIALSPAALECRVWQVLDAAPQRVIVLARVVALYLRDDALLDAQRFHVDTPALRLLGRMHGAGWYAHTSDLFQMRAPDAANDPAVRPAQGH